MEFVNTLKARLPDYAKDIRLNLDAVIARSSLTPIARRGRGARRSVRRQVGADRGRHPRRRDARRRPSQCRAHRGRADGHEQRLVSVRRDERRRRAFDDARRASHERLCHARRRRPPELRALRARGVDRRQVRVLRAVALQAAQGDRPHHAAVARRRAHRGGGQRRGAGDRRRIAHAARRIAA